MRPSFLLALFAILCCPALAFSATLHVPAQYPTIQDGIDAAATGDVVMVAPGDYKENLDYLGKAITVVSSNGPEVTTIRNTLLWASVIKFETKEGLDSVIEGFTLTDGTGTDYYHLGGLLGGAILCLGTSPTIRNNIIVDNSAYFGGGIECIQGASPHILSNIIMNNSIPFQSGGGIDIYDNSHPLIKGNIIAGNDAIIQGGGIALWEGCQPYIVHNTICNNDAPEGGGMFSKGLPMLVNNIIWENTPKQMFGVYTNTSYCNIQGGFPGNHNIDEDPKFVNPAAQDYHLTRYSPCINRCSFKLYTDKDIDGDNRSIMGTPDMGADEYAGEHLLEADNFEIMETTGGKVSFDVKAGPGYAFRSYVILASVSGTNPGVALPGGFATLPLNWDTLTSRMIYFINTPSFAGFSGTLDSLGEAKATFDTLGPISNAAGITVSFAAGLYGPWDLTTNPINVEIK